MEIGKWKEFLEQDMPAVYKMGRDGGMPVDITLDALKTGKMAVVTKIDNDALLKRKLKVCGLIPGTIVRCRFRSPEGCTVALELRGSVVFLPSADLQRIHGCGLYRL